MIQPILFINNNVINLKENNENNILFYIKTFSIKY